MDPEKDVASLGGTSYWNRLLNIAKTKEGWTTLSKVAAGSGMIILTTAVTLYFWALWTEQDPVAIFEATWNIPPMLASKILDLIVDTINEHTGYVIMTKADLESSLSEKWWAGYGFGFISGASVATPIAGACGVASTAFYWVVTAAAEAFFA